MQRFMDFGVGTLLLRCVLISWWCFIVCIEDGLLTIQLLIAILAIYTFCTSSIE